MSETYFFLRNHTGAGRKRVNSSTGRKWKNFPNSDFRKNNEKTDKFNNINLLTFCMEMNTKSKVKRNDKLGKNICNTSQERVDICNV